eukprot:SAG22_NODE_1021_length_5998_cov_2.167316_4_plen_169_part_00
MSGAGSRLAFDGVTVVEQPELAVLTGSVTIAGGGAWTVEPADLPLPTIFVVESGPCTVAEGGRCVGRWPGGYLPDEDCDIAVAGGSGTLGPCPVIDLYGRTLPGDYLAIGGPGGTHYTGSNCPTGVVLAEGQTLSFHSDYGHQGAGGDGLPMNAGQEAGGGWQICFGP